MESWTFRGEKPPLGAKPYYIAYVERIYDLADAIRRTDDVDDIRYYQAFTVGIFRIGFLDMGTVG